MAWTMYIPEEYIGASSVRFLLSFEEERCSQVHLMLMEDLGKEVK
jgi:hypothetical protein